MPVTSCVNGGNYPKPAYLTGDHKLQVKIFIPINTMQTQSIIFIPNEKPEHLLKYNIEGEPF